MRSQDFYAEVRQQNRNIWNGINALISLQREYTANDFGNTLPDGTDEHDGLDRTEIGAVVFDTADALAAVLNAGHATNMAKLL